MNKTENTFGLTDRDLETISVIFKKHPAVKEVWLFGSRAKGNHSPGSDIDLAIMNEGVCDQEMSQLKAAFVESLLPYFVDLVNYPSLKHQPLKEHIDRVGKMIYDRKN